MGPDEEGWVIQSKITAVCAENRVVGKEMLET